MIAIDTNVLVRLVTDDDEAQSARAAHLFASDDVWLSKTVLLETEWVLRGAYHLDPEAIHEVFERLLSTVSVSIESSEAVRLALSWFHTGMDFADALHLASVSTAEKFATFDRKLARRARRIEDAPAVESL